MADGTTRTLSEIKVGDEVVATDPETGQTSAQPVTALHHNLDTDLVDVTVAPATDDDADAAGATFHTTSHHPFWDAGSGQWADAADLKPGESVVVGTAGQRQTVVAVARVAGPKYMRDLTVAVVHTYYVIAGETRALVHNCNNVISNADEYDNAGALGAHGNGTAFSGIYEPNTGYFRAHLSVDAANMLDPPVNSVLRFGGHGQINFEHFGGSRETVGFTMFIEEDGFSVSWMSRSVNGRNHGNPQAPEDARQSIMEAIAAATGRRVWSR